KSLRLGERYFLVPMIAVERDLAGHAWFFDEHRIGAASQESDFGLQEYGVPQSVFAGQNLNGAASLPRDVIDGGLEDFVRCTNQVRFLRTDGHRQARFPVRFDPIAVNGSRARVLGTVVRLGVHGGKSCRGQAAAGLQELPALKGPGNEGSHGGIPFLSVTTRRIAAPASS